MAGPYKVPSSHQGTAKPTNQAAHPTNNGDAISHKAKSFEIFYDPNRMMFWIPNSRDGWVTIKGSDVRRMLKERGCRGEIIKGKESVSEIDSLLTIFQLQFDVDYAGSLAGHQRGVYDIEGKRILVKDSPVLIECLSPENGLYSKVSSVTCWGQIRRFFFLDG
jgi:hypothetical protein